MATTYEILFLWYFFVTVFALHCPHGVCAEYVTEKMFPKPENPGNITQLDVEARFAIAERASALAPVANIADYPFVVSISTPLPTQGMGVIVHKNWAITRDALVFNYMVDTRSIKIKSDSLDVSTGGNSHRALKVVLNPGAVQAPTYVNIMALVKVCPPFRDGTIVTMPLSTSTWPTGTSVTVLRWQNDLTTLKFQTAAIQNACFNTLLVCTETIGLNTFDMGVPIVSTTKVLVGINTRRSLGSTAREGYENIAKYLTWINSVIVT